MRIATFLGANHFNKWRAHFPPKQRRVTFGDAALVRHDTHEPKYDLVAHAGQSSSNMDIGIGRIDHVGLEAGGDGEDA
jgi:hypothetical protein